MRSTGLIGGPKDADVGRLSTLSRVDIGRLQQQVDEPLYPMSVDLTSQDPAQVGLLPVAVPPPVLDEGPHLNYAGQWFIFATLTVIVYPLADATTGPQQGRRASRKGRARPSKSSLMSYELSAER